jgi:hypothetical protein
MESKVDLKIVEDLWSRAMATRKEAGWFGGPPSFLDCYGVTDTGNELHYGLDVVAQHKFVKMIVEMAEETAAEEIEERKHFPADQYDEFVDPSVRVASVLIALDFGPKAVADVVASRIA